MPVGSGSLFDSRPLCATVVAAHPREERPVWDGGDPGPKPRPEASRRKVGVVRNRCQGDHRPGYPDPDAGGLGRARHGIRDERKGCRGGNEPGAEHFPDRPGHRADATVRDLPGAEA